MPELDIIIPVYNEGRNIPATLRALARDVSARARVFICYDFDEDDTLPAAEAHRPEYPQLAIEYIKNKGRGAHAAIMTGFARSTAPFVLMYPADDDYNAGIIDAMLGEARKGAEIVCASRFMRGGSMAGCPPLKNFLVRTGNWVLRHLARIPTHDASNGFRLFSRRVIAEIPVESETGFAYSIELLAKAHRLGWKVAEVPAQWFERRQGQSRFKVLQWLPAYLRWCRYAFATTYLHRHRAFTLLMGAVLLLSVVPVFQAAFYIGGEWRGVPQVYMDEYIYYSHITEAGTGNLLFGNPYLIEHRFDAPLVLFGSDILAALPLLAGLPLYLALVFNFMLWSLIFAVLYYRLAREFILSQWASAGIALFAYLQSYDQIYRTSVRQEVFPFLLLFYIALIRFLRQPEEKKSLLFLGAAAGASFYIYGFLWQTVVVTLGLLALYSLAARQWQLLRRTLLASALGGVLGFPPFFYDLWITHQPYFWESMTRFGLVNTHLPVGEVVYSGAWAGLAVAFFIFLYWRVPALRAARATALFVTVTGLALWIMQGSNVLTGQLLELGDHLRRFIIMWLPLATLLGAYAAWDYRRHLSTAMKIIAGAALFALLCANLYFAYLHSHPFRDPSPNVPVWKEQQLYAAPLHWLDEKEPQPVVVWGDPALFSTAHVPVLTKHYVLFEEPALFMLASTDELRERYLVSHYFDSVTAESLKEDMLPHAGRANTYHLPKTIERKVKLCRILFFWDKGHDCGTIYTPQELMGEAYFDGLASRFANDIRPHIKDYLKKYHVSYILKDVMLNPDWAPQTLGAKEVYNDGRFELYKLP